MKYQVALGREDGQWTGQCVDYPEAVDYAPTLRGLFEGLKDAIILSAELPDDAVVEVELVAGETLDADLTRALKLAERRADLAAAEAQLQERTAQTAAVLRSEGYTVRDIAALTGISPGRASQLAAV